MSTTITHATSPSLTPSWEVAARILIGPLYLLGLVYGYVHYGQPKYGVDPSTLSGQEIIITCVMLGLWTAIMPADLTDPRLITWLGCKAKRIFASWLIIGAVAGASWTCLSYTSNRWPGAVITGVCLVALAVCTYPALASREEGTRSGFITLVLLAVVFGGLGAVVAHDGQQILGAMALASGLTLSAGLVQQQLWPILTSWRH